EGDYLNLTAQGRQPVSIDGFTGSAIRVFDITDPASVQELLGTVVQGKAGYAVSLFVPGDGPRRLLAFTPPTTKRAASLSANVPSDLRNPSRGADMIILTHRSLLESARRLQGYRQGHGLSVDVVDVDDVLDEFSFGNRTPQALRDF